MFENQKHTRGPWRWRRFGQQWALATTHSGSLIVMDFERLGLRGAQPRFASRSDGMGGLMVTAAEIGDVREHPDARLLEAAPDLLAALKRLAHIAVWDDDFDEEDRAEFDAAMTDATAAITKAEGPLAP